MKNLVCIARALVACYVTCAAPSPSLATTWIPNASFLDVFDECGPNRTIICGEIVGARNDTIVTPHGRESIRPVLTLSVKLVLAGHAEQVEEFWGINTFVFRDDQWCPKATAGRPWLLPGDMVVLVVDDYEGYKDVRGSPIMLRQIRWQAFLLDSDPTETSVIYEQSGLNSGNLLKLQGQPAASLETVMSSLTQDFVPTRYRLSDVIYRVNAAVGGKK